MAWQKIGTPITLVNAGDNMEITDLTALKFNQIIIHALGTGGTIGLRGSYNSDAGTNYAWRFSENGGADSTSTSASIIGYSSTSQNNDAFYVGYLINIATEEKLNLGHVIHNVSTGAGTAPLRSETVGKWSNTTNQISSSSKCNNAGTGDYGTNSNFSLLGTSNTVDTVE